MKRVSVLLVVCGLAVALVGCGESAAPSKPAPVGAPLQHDVSTGPAHAAPESAAPAEGEKKEEAAPAEKPAEEKKEAEEKPAEEKKE